MALGFYETNINGQRVIAHGGDTVAFHSDLHLFLDDGVGIFVSFNSAGKEGAAQPLRTRCSRDSPTAISPRPHAVARSMPRRRQGRRARSWPASVRPRAVRAPTSSAIADLIGQTKVGVDEDGNPLIRRAEGPRRPAAQMGRTSARCCGATPNGHEMLAAKVVDGKATASASAAGADHRFRPDALVPLVGLAPAAALRSLAVLLLTGVLWPARALVRRRYKADARPRRAAAAGLPLEPDRGVAPSSRS